MGRPVSIELEFSWGYPLGGGEAADFDCSAVADVTLYRSSYDDPGGADIENFRDFMVEVHERVRTGKGWQRRWVKADPYLTGLLRQYVESGALDLEFQEAAQDAGGRCDHERELRAAQ